MSNKRRILNLTQPSEAARRQLMQPVPCWVKVWAVPEGAAPGSKLKVPKWVRTEKQQEFSDDEDDTIDLPLAPLPEEVMEVDDEADGDDGADATGPATQVGTPDVAPPAAAPAALDPALDPAFAAGDGEVEVPVIDVADIDVADIEVPDIDVPALTDEDAAALAASLDAGAVVDLEGLPPAGTPFEAVGDLAQVGENAEDVMLGGKMMDESGDPFVGVQ